MKKTLYTAVAAALIITSCQMNPLLKESSAPFGAPEFDKIKIEHYAPAFEKGLEKAKQEFDAIVNNPEAPTFANTIEALSSMGETLDHAANIFFNLNECCTNPQMQELAEELAPKLTEFSNMVSLSKPLFERVKSVWDNRDSFGLSSEQYLLLEKNYKGFVRGGALLDDEQKKVYSELSQQATVVGLQFGKNVLSATNAFTLHLTDEADLAGLPDYLREAAAEEAKNRNMEGWVFTLQAPSYSPFLRYSERRELREKMWRAYNTKCIGDEFANDDNIHKIVDLNLRTANILGYPTCADLALEDRMAKNVSTVMDFENSLMAATLPYARKEVKEIEDYARSKGFTGSYMPWDQSYWSEKYRKEKYDLDAQLLKPYFELNAVRDAIFGLAGTLYGLSFNSRTDIPVYHPDVQVFEVKDGERFMGLLYMDFFPRESKRGGAWMTSFRNQGFVDGKDQRPFIQLVTNFTKPTSTTPSLLTFDEVETFLHEFGHCLHGLLSDCRYTAQSCTSVSRDFVELPSQIMENWAYEPEWLNGFARHWENGENIPAEYVERLVAAKNFLAAYSCVRQLEYGLIDMNWFSTTSVPTEDAVTFEHKVLAASEILPLVEGCAMSPQFNHIFSGGYTAGYYSYKWAEVLEADAFSLFREKGIFSKEVAASFRANILSRGGSADPAELYRAFRGRDPRPESLLEKYGLK